MAVPKKSDDEKLRDILRPALDGSPRSLVGTKATGALFAKAANPLLSHARQEGYLVEVPAPPQPPPKGNAKPKTPIYAKLTDKGRQFVLAGKNPARLVEGLSAQLQTQATAVAQATATAATQVAECRQMLQHLDQTLQARLVQFQQTGATLQARLDSLGTPAGTAAVPTAAWLEDLLAFVRERKRQNALSQPNLKDVYDHLRKTQPTLTVGQFHDGLRLLQEQNRIRLTPYTMPLATLPDLLLALYLDREVKYYVDVR